MSSRIKSKFTFFLVKFSLNTPVGMTSVVPLTPQLKITALMSELRDVYGRKRAIYIRWKGLTELVIALYWRLQCVLLDIFYLKGDAKSDTRGQYINKPKGPQSADPRSQLSDPSRQLAMT